MQNVSRAYKESMRGRIRNRGYIRATIGIFNQDAQKALTVNDTESPLLYLSNKETAFAGVTPERIYATAEQDFSKLDGTRYFAPEEGSGYEIYNNGLISDGILGDIYIDFGGESFDIKGLTIDFGEFYPTEFVIETNVVTRQYSEIDRGLWTTEDAWDNVSFFRIVPLSMVNGSGRLRILSKENVKEISPQILFRDVVTNYGYPIISKHVSQVIKEVRKSGNFETVRGMQLLGTYKKDNGQPSEFNCEKYLFMYNAPFLISDECCNVMKKSPLHLYDEQSGRKAIIATMADESKQRMVNWQTYGCNAFGMEYPQSRPMSFWTEQDVLTYIHTYIHTTLPLQTHTVKWL